MWLNSGILRGVLLWIFLSLWQFLCRTWHHFRRITNITADCINTMESNLVVCCCKLCPFTCRLFYYDKDFIFICSRGCEDLLFVRGSSVLEKWWEQFPERIKCLSPGGGRAEWIQTETGYREEKVKETMMRMWVTRSNQEGYQWENPK